MNLLIAGGAGFIGTHLTRCLLRQGHEVTILDNFLPQVHGDSRELCADLAEHVRLIRGDVADRSAWEAALPGAECVIHLAAETGTGQSMYEVARYERTNMAGTAAFFDVLVKEPGRRVERLVVASSRAIYGEGAYRCPEHGIVYPRSRPVAEKKAGLFDPVCPVCGGPLCSIATPEIAPLQPSSFYGLTKQVQEQMTLMFCEALEIPAVALRYQNVYGPGQSLSNPYTGILAIFSNLARSSQPIQIFEDGAESRDFVYIDDVVDATCASIFQPLSGNCSLNVGSGERITVLDVATEICRFYGSTSEVKITGAFREGDIRHGVADLAQIRSLLQYSPSWHFSAGLGRFLEWAAENAAAEGGYIQSLVEMSEWGLLRG